MTKNSRFKLGNLGKLFLTVVTLTTFSFLCPGPVSALDDKENLKSWLELLPKPVRDSVLWCADHEEGTLFDWEFDRDPKNNGGGIFNTGKPEDALAEVDQNRPFTGKYCAKVSIRNAFRGRDGKKAVRLMRWTDKPWDQGGAYLPKTAYYGVWMRIDHKYSTFNPGSPSGGWWNVFQFKSNDEEGNSQPIWVLNVGNQKKTGKMLFYLYSDKNRPSSISQPNPITIPVGKWIHVEALYVQSEKNKSNGKISIWQDGKLILNANNVKTISAENAIWGIGNYTDHISGEPNPGSATIYFDDATISTKPTHEHVGLMKNR